MVLSLENAGNTTMESVVVSVSTSDSLILQNNTSTFVIKQIAPGKTEKLPLKLKAGKELTGSTQSISVDLKYNYDAGDEMAQGSSTERVNIPVNAAEAAEDGSVPNVVVSDFQFGESTVAAGRTLPAGLHSAQHRQASGGKHDRHCGRRGQLYSGRRHQHLLL